MLFNSLTFLLFFLLVYSLYLLLRRQGQAQNAVLLIASYLFYAFWDWRFLSLILVSTLVDYHVGKRLGSTTDESAGTNRKYLLAASVVANLTLLGFFKYFNFFADSFADLFRLLGMQLDPITLRVILPVGISFYTFQTMSYTIDVYRRRIAPTSNLLNFALFVAFFPQLVAGPIERAANLLPQVEKARRVSLWQIDAGLFLILWGYFKKVVIADNAGLIANRIFDNYTTHTGLAVVVGVLAFAVQIYGDFSGYSDIARGVSRLMGFELMVNFKLPYFALNPSDFWQRWHVSLSSWLRDYLYIPLGGNRLGESRTYLNLSITMLLGGLWHGAAWNFVVWGAFHGLILMLYRRYERNPILGNPWSGDLRPMTVLGKWALMFSLTLVGWLLFRATSMPQIWYMLTHVSIVPSGQSLQLLAALAALTAPLLLVQLWQYVSNDLLVVTKIGPWRRSLVYGGMLIGILTFGVREPIEFIYFQF